MTYEKNVIYGSVKSLQISGNFFSYFVVTLTVLCQRQSDAALCEYLNSNVISRPLK